MMNRQIFDRLKSGYPGLLNVLNVLLGVLLVIISLVLIRDIMSETGKKNVNPGPYLYSPVKITRKSLQDYAPLVRNNLFGGPGGELRPLSGSGGAQAAKNGTSDLVLIGTVAGSRKNSYAIFTDKGGNQEIFHVGDAVHGLGILKRVKRDKVFLGRGGVLNEMPIADLVTIVDANPAQAAARPASFARSVGEDEFVLDQRRVQQAIERPNQIMTDARLLPNIVQGRQQGFILAEVKPGGIYQSLGLRNGDVLLRINEFNISNPEAALQAFTALRGMDRVRLDIMRNGAKMTMNYQIR